MRLRKPLLLVATAVLFLGAAPLVADTNADADSSDGPRPGLPRHTGAGPWVGVAQGGITETKRAKQWVRVPMQVTTAFTHTTTVWPETYRREVINTNWVYLMAEPGARYNYGLSAPFQVNAIAFGTIPVTATLRLSQERTPEGLPEPLAVRAVDEAYTGDGHKPPDWPSYQKFHDTDISAALYVEVEGLRVDGTDLRLRAGCRTASAATLDLHGEGFFDNDPDVEARGVYATGKFTVIMGGLLTGTADVPAFHRCRTRTGEDVSQLLTSTISGEGNAVTLHAGGGFSCGRFPNVGEYQPEVGCPAGTPPTVPLP